MSKLNPQKASAYVGPGVLRKGGKITPVPNGPLIKKKGPFKGSTLKAGGAVKKAQNGFQTVKPYEKSIKSAKQLGIRGNDTFRITGEGKIMEKASNPEQAEKLKAKNTKDSINTMTSRNRMVDSANRMAAVKKMKQVANRPMKAGGMIKRADGSFSKRGLWDNIRANKGSGKKPTKQMLVQEKKIKAKTKK
jgi:hypothetical protein